MQLNINTDAVVSFTNKLEKMHKSALPSAIRGALNKAAFDVKTNTLQKSADKSFEKRQPNFFKANSRFENAKGFDVNTMKATIGMVSTGLKGTSNYAVKDLEQQEDGGSIGGKSFIPMKPARIGGNKNVRANARMAAIKNKIIDANKVEGGSKRQKFIRAVFAAKKINGFVLGNKWGGGNQTLSRIDQLSSTLNRKLIIKRTPLYTFRKGRKITVAGTNFMKRASMESGLSIERFYVLEAIRQFKKLK